MECRGLAASHRHLLLLQDEWVDLRADASEWSPPIAGHAMHGGLPPGAPMFQALP